METSLHRDLKQLYAAQDARVEVKLGRYRIDVVTPEALVEIQLGSLSAIRDKIARLLVDHRVVVVKPIVARKLLIKTDEAGGAVVSRRLSPKRGTLLELFDELIYFTRVFPHPRLALEVLLVEIEEWRHPGHGRRRRWRRGDLVVADQKLLSIAGSERFETAADLLRLLPAALPRPFHTGHLAESLSVRRFVAQRIAYSLRNIGAIEPVGKQANAWLYRRGRPARRKTA